MVSLFGYKHEQNWLGGVWPRNSDREDTDTPNISYFNGSVGLPLDHNPDSPKLCTAVLNRRDNARNHSNKQR